MKCSSEAGCSPVPESVVLIFVGLKMLGSHYVYIPTEWVLAIVLFVLAASILASLANPQKKLAE